MTKSMSEVKFPEFQLVDPSAYKRKLYASQIKPGRLNIPAYIQKLVVDNSLADIPEEDERAKIFLQEMYARRIKGSTINSHFRRLKPLLFPNTKIIPNSLAFDSRKPSQLRVPDFESVSRVLAYLKETVTDTRRWPILLAYYTGLRLSEVARFSTEHLSQLLQRKKVVSLNRKNNVQWSVVYIPQFCDFVDELRSHFDQDFQRYTQFNTNSLIFKTSVRMIHYNVRAVFLEVNRYIPPLGYGLHTLRYYVATKLYDKGEIGAARVFLGHKKLQTTARYIKTDNIELEKTLSNINTKDGLYKQILARTTSSIEKSEKIDSIGELL